MNPLNQEDGEHEPSLSRGGERSYFFLIIAKKLVYKSIVKKSSILKIWKEVS